MARPRTYWPPTIHLAREFARVIGQASVEEETTDSMTDSIFRVPAPADGWSDSWSRTDDWWFRIDFGA